MKYELTLKEYFAKLDNDWYPEVGDLLRILPDRKIVDLSGIIGTSIPMLFSNKDLASTVTGKLADIADGTVKPYMCDMFWYGSCQFDISADSWIPWGRHVPWYKGICPLPDGVEYVVETRDGAKWDKDGWEHVSEPTDIIAFRVTGLEDGWLYPEHKT